jgi:hypothetical protein
MDTPSTSTHDQHIVQLAAAAVLLHEGIEGGEDLRHGT